MSKELVISANRHETRVAILEDDQVVEVYHQRENEYSLAGSIHKGRVTRVLPGMQSAFVDIGLDRDAFLYVSDFFEDNEEYDKIVTSVEEQVFKQIRPGGGPAVAPAVNPASVSAAPVMEGAPAAESAAPSADSPAGAVTNGAPPVMTNGAAGPSRDSRQQNDDRRGGRRGRRRRGQQKGGGRGLPESKFYSPGARGGGESEERPEARPEPVEASESVEAAPAAASEVDDFFVLPGESLAKYRGPGEEDSPEAADGGEGEPEERESDGTITAEETAIEVEAVLAPEADAGPAAVQETQEEAAAEPVAQPPGELAEVAREVAEELVTHQVAVEPVAEVIAPVAEEAVAAAPEVAAPEVAASETAAPEAAADVVESAEDVDPLPADAAEPEAPSEQTLAEEAMDALEAGDGMEFGDAADGAGEAVEGAATEEEGPEPARIPTSLTATLREQNPRYLQHRVSRRMRRRGGRGEGREGGGREGGGRGEGRDNRGAAAGPAAAADAVRAPQQETRQVETRQPERAERTEGRPPQAPRGDARPERANPSITDLLKEGQEIIVQIAKEPLGQKGARITSHIALPGRFLVYMPTVDHIGVSRKIPSDDERLRLKRILQTHRTGIPGGYIVRTAGDGRTEEELRADMMFLYNLWLDMRQKAERRPAPLLIHHDLNVVERVLRDQLTTAFKSIWVDNEEAYESILRFVQRFQPALVNRVKLYTRSTPIFDEYGITAELEKALRPKVWLKSGGYIVINQTEALVAIDINTGKYVGKSNRLEDTIVKTNTDAIKEIVRQIRLRDLGGIIVVDFIDMDERKNRQKVMQALEEAMRTDRAPNKILQFNDFGLVAITRKRVKQSLERTLCTPCPYCEGAGYVKSPQTVVGEILQEAQKISKVVEGKDVMLRVGPEVAKMLKSNQNSYLQELEEILGRTVIVKSDNQLHQEKFDLA